MNATFHTGFFPTLRLEGKQLHLLEVKKLRGMGPVRSTSTLFSEVRVNRTCTKKTCRTAEVIIGNKVSTRVVNNSKADALASLSATLLHRVKKGSCVGFAGSIWERTLQNLISCSLCWKRLKNWDHRSQFWRDCSWWTEKLGCWMNETTLTSSRQSKYTGGRWKKLKTMQPKWGRKFRPYPKNGTLQET